MTFPLQPDSPVMDAVRAFLGASPARAGVSDPWDSLLAETSRLPLTQLDNLERMIRTELWSIQSRRLSFLQKLGGSRSRPLSWLDLCSWDGFVRERALRAVSAGAPNGFFCALALRRLNDWVPQVRQAAREQVQLIARRSAAEHVADALWCILPHATSWGRMERKDWDVLEQLLSIEPVAIAIKTRIKDSTAGPASLILAQTGRSSVLDHQLGEIASDAIQPAVRARAYRSLFEQRVVWVVGRRWVWTDLKWGKRRLEPVVGERSFPVETPFLDLLTQGMGDRSPMVRRVAAEFLIKHLDAIGADSFRMAERLASDPSPYVAARGRFALERLGR